MLFIDARHMFRQIDRAHRDFLPEQIEFLANIVRLYRGEELETVAGSAGADWPSTSPTAPTPTCPASARSPRSPRSRRRAGASTPAATSASPRPTRTTATSRERLAELHEEFTALSDEAEVLRRKVDAAVQGILEG